MKLIKELVQLQEADNEFIMTGKGGPYAVKEKGINPSTKNKRSKDGKDYYVAKNMSKAEAEKHCKNLGGERHGVYVVKESLDEALPGAYFAPSSTRPKKKAPKRSQKDWPNAEHVKAREIKKNDWIQLGKKRFFVNSINKEGGKVSFNVRGMDGVAGGPSRFTNAMYPDQLVLKLSSNKVKEDLNEAMSPSALRKTIVDAAKLEGFKLDSQESTPGTLKAWMDPTQGSLSDKDFETFIGKLSKRLPELKIRFQKPIHSNANPTAMGKGFEIECGHGIIVVVYRKGQAGQEYQMGMDT